MQNILFFSKKYIIKKTIKYIMQNQLQFFFQNIKKNFKSNFQHEHVQRIFITSFLQVKK